jgi:hypothetical protein
MSGSARCPSAVLSRAPARPVPFAPGPRFVRRFSLRLSRARAGSIVLRRSAAPSLSLLSPRVDFVLSALNSRSCVTCVVGSCIILSLCGKGLDLVLFLLVLFAWGRNIGR